MVFTELVAQVVSSIIVALLGLWMTTTVLTVFDYGYLGSRAVEAAGVPVAVQQWQQDVQSSTCASVSPNGPGGPGSVLTLTWTDAGGNAVTVTWQQTGSTLLRAASVAEQTTTTTEVAGLNAADPASFEVLAAPAPAGEVQMNLADGSAAGYVPGSGPLPFVVLGSEAVPGSGGQTC